MLKEVQKQELQQTRLAKREERQRLRQEKCGEMKGFLLEKREEIKLRWRSEAANSAENGKAEMAKDMQEKAAEDSEDKETGKEIRDGGIKIMDAAKIVPVEKK